MATLTARQTNRLAHRTELALTVAIVIGVIEILRRAPRWLLLFAGFLIYTVVLAAIAYVWWIVGVLLAVIAWKALRGLVQGWRQAG